MTLSTMTAQSAIKQGRDMLLQQIPDGDYRERLAIFGLFTAQSKLLEV